MLGDLFEFFVGPVLTAYVVRSLWSRRAERLRARQLVYCAVRVLPVHPGADVVLGPWPGDAPQPGATVRPTPRPSSRWRHGKAELSPGLIRFKDMEIAVPGNVALLRGRWPSLRESWSVNPRCRILQINTPAAVVEWAVPSEYVSWALAELAS